MDYYTPSEAVAKSGFSLDTLRYYEKIGLLSDVARDASGRRRFSDDDLGRLFMLRCLRDTGMPIAEMLRFTRLVREGDHTLAERAALLEEHDQRVERQIALLREQQGRIQWKIRHYRDKTTSAPVAAPA